MYRPLIRAMIQLANELLANLGDPNETIIKLAHSSGSVAWYLTSS